MATELEKAKSAMRFYQRQGNYHGYKQAKAHYEKLLRKEKQNANLQSH